MHAGSMSARQHPGKKERRGQQNLPTAAQSAEAHGARAMRERANPMHTPPEPQSRRSVRMDAGLDTQTRAKLEGLATAFHRSRAAVLRQVIRWGLERKMAGPVDGGKAPGPSRGPFLLIDSALHQQVQEAAKAAGVNVAPWMRHLMRQIRRSDFPQSWRAGQAGRRHPTGQRSHDSRYYGTRFMLRLDAMARARLEALASHFDASQAELIRQLIVQATVEDFPPRWHLAVGERRRRPRRRTS
jgi:predicted transcriptional regulator